MKRRKLKRTDFRDDLLENAALEGFYTYNHTFKDGLHRKDIKDISPIPRYDDILHAYNYHKLFYLDKEEGVIDTNDIIIGEHNLKHKETSDNIRVTIKVTGELYVKQNRRKYVWYVDKERNSEDQLQLEYVYEYFDLL